MVSSYTLFCLPALFLVVTWLGGSASAHDFPYDEAKPHMQALVKLFEAEKAKVREELAAAKNGTSHIEEPSRLEEELFELDSTSARIAGWIAEWGPADSTLERAELNAHQFLREISRAKLPLSDAKKREAENHLELLKAKLQIAQSDLELMMRQHQAVEAESKQLHPYEEKALDLFAQIEAHKQKELMDGEVAKLTKLIATLNKLMSQPKH